MGSVWGEKIKISLFGESHQDAIGVVIDGLPAGIQLDLEFIKNEMARRRPGKNVFSTTRNEDDEFKIISGYFNEKTTGTPLCCIIENKNKKSKDYDKIKNIIRPGHADYTGYIRYKGFNDYRGGGHFSGRITAPLVFAGAIAKQILTSQGIIIGAHIKSIGNILDDSFDYCNVDKTILENISKKEFPVINDEKGALMQELILNLKNKGDSAGGIIETAIINLNEGIGSPFFDSVESKLAHILFSVPAVKGVEFGEGFNITTMTGFEANDEYYIKDGKIKTKTNNNGGILGGITNGMPVIFKVAIKPTPSIFKLQRSVNIQTMEEVDFKIEGRHDACIVPRVVPVIEAVTAICILDIIS